LSVRDQQKDPITVAKEIKTFMARIGFDDSIVNNNAKIGLQEYIRIFHLNISWYVTKIKAVSQKKKNFFRLGFGLIVLIPISIFGLTAMSGGVTPSSFGAIVTLFLTVILGLYKATSVWLESKKFEGLFWQASSDLKNRLYSMENRWEERVDGNTIEDFIEEVESEIIEGRKIVQEETRGFFEHYTTPILDVGGILTSASSQASSLFNAFQAPSFKRKMEQESEKLRNEIKLEHNYRQVEFLKQKQKLLVKRIKKVSDNLRTEKDPVQIKRLTAQKETLESELDASVYQLMMREAERVLYK
jgi:hypothetical protein